MINLCRAPGKASLSERRRFVLERADTTMNTTAVPAVQSLDPTQTAGAAAKTIPAINSSLIEIFQQKLLLRCGGADLEMLSLI